MPEDSWPITIGALTTKSPMRPCFKKWMSLPQIPTLRMATRTYQGEEVAESGHEAVV
jgi:hypothetical protein